MTLHSVTVDYLTAALNYQNHALICAENLHNAHMGRKVLISL